MIGLVPQLLSTAVGTATSLAQPSTALAKPAQGADFSQVLAQVSGDALNTIKNGEAMSIQGIEGNASPQQVVEAVISAQQTLQTVVAVRDKLVAAYQQISQMAI